MVVAAAIVPVIAHLVTKFYPTNAVVPSVPLFILLVVSVHELQINAELTAFR